MEAVDTKNDSDISAGKSGALFMGFQAKILLLVCGFLILSQSAFFIIYDYRQTKNTNSIIMENLNATQDIFKRILNERFDTLTKLVQLLSTDFGFRSAVAVSEKETIDSMMENHLNRIGADIIFAFNTDGTFLTSYPKNSPEAVVDSFKYVFGNPDLEGLIENKLLTMIVFKGQPYQVVMVPVKAPNLIAYTAIGFLLSEEFVEYLKNTSKVEVSFIEELGNKTNILISTNISKSYEDEFLKKINAHKLEKGPFSIFVDKEEYMTFKIPVFDLGGEGFSVIMQGSLTQANKPYLQDRKFMLALAFFFVVISIPIGMLLSRQIMQPIKSLIVGVKKVETGNYDIKLDMSRRDEIGTLTKGFDNMLDGLTKTRNALKDRELKLKSALREAEKAKVFAEKANQAKTEFLATMTHELRTPLNSILGITDMMIKDKSMQGDDKKMLQIVNESGLSLLSIVNNVLDISKIETGNIVLDNAGFDFRERIVTIIECMAPIASARGLSLHCHYENDEIPYLIGDTFRLGQILTNLLSNAIKYTDKGRIKITINCQPVDHKNVEIYCAVQDTGIGIPKEKLEVIFKRFVQADSAITRKFGGTGLGLAITEELVKIMGGTIGVESEMGSGSTFWFRIPFELTNQLDQDAQKKKENRSFIDTSRAYLQVEKAKVLIAEDHLLNQELIARILKRMGFKYSEIFDNGLLAVNAFENDDYDLILMDCHMPEKDGYEATAEIRNSKKKVGEVIPIVALTADVMKGTRTKCLKAGMNDYVSKPIDGDKLKEVLSQWVIFSETQGKDDDKEKSKNSDKGLINWDILKGFADTPEDISRFINLFISESDKGIARLEENNTNKECDDWLEAAHKLKGGAGMVGASELQRLCQAAETLLDVTIEERKEIFDLIDREYKKVRIHLKEAMT